jgi:hypothetical protein
MTRDDATGFGTSSRESDRVGPRRTTSDNVGCAAEMVGGLCGPGVRAAIRSSDLTAPGTLSVLYHGIIPLTSLSSV